MALFKCKMCGGALEINNNETVATCEYCGTQQTLPRLDDDRKANLYDRANHFRRNNEFDKAMGIYEQILNEDKTDSEAYWSLVLCRYGIEYVEDPASHKRIPTVNRAQFTSIFDDDNYRSALQYADGYQRAIYEEEAKTINEIQKGILAISQKEEPFDVFICYKETDSNGRRTHDSVLANDLYHQLTQEGFKVFFARITLEDKLGSAYEPYIFAALNSSKVMVVLGTRPEFFNAVWVKNEWSRYLALIKQGQKKMLIPAYKDMDPYDLPEEFSHLQAQDMSKLGFMQDLIRGIKKIIQEEAPKATVVKETVVTGGNTNTAPLLKRAFMFLEDGDWNSADEYCERVLDVDPENADAYLGKLMAELQVKRKDSLIDCDNPFDNNSNYQKALRFADNNLKAELSGYIEHINARNENARLDGIYIRAKRAMSAANTEDAYKEAAHLFETIGEYKDSPVLANECYEQSDVVRKDAILARAKSQMNADLIFGYETAIKILENIPGWKDADETAYACKRRMEELKAKEEEDRLESERQAEIARQKAEKQAKRNKKIAIIIFSAIVACIALVTLWFKVLSPMIRYNKAQTLLDSGSYDEAVVIFAELEEYKDSATKVFETKYAKAESLFASKNYDDAVAIFEELKDYKDSPAKVFETKYAKAENLFAIKIYDGAVAIFAELADYSDSADRIKEVKYSKAGTLSESKDYAQAADIYKELGEYRDSETLYPETLLNYATALVEKKDLAGAENQLYILDKFDAYAEDANALYVRVMDAYYADGKYDKAISAYKNTKDYSEDSDKYKDLTYKHAQSMLDDKNYSIARLYFVKCSGYMDADEKMLECDYQYGNQEMIKKNYNNAVNAFSKLDNYKDSAERLKEAKYQYALSYKNNKNPATYTYLKELKAIGYKDSADIFKELYAWKVEIVVNDDKENRTKEMSSISKYSNWYFHISLSGGEPNAETEIKYTGYFPNGDALSNKWDGKCSDGTHGRCWFYYSNPAYGKQGTFTLNVYDGNGNLIGEKTVKITG